MGLYNSSTQWWTEDHKQQMVGGVPVDSPQSNQLVAQPKPLRTRWSYSGRARSSLQNGVVVQVTIDYKVFVAAGAGLEVRQGAILKNPNDDGDYFKVWSATPIYSYGTRIDHWELEVQRDGMAGRRIR